MVNCIISQQNNRKEWSSESYMNVKLLFESMSKLEGFNLGVQLAQKEVLEIFLPLIQSLGEIGK